MADNRVPPFPTTAPLVGREREQDALRDALAAALAGRGSLVLVGGEAGIGKTALAETLLAEAADQGAQVLVGRCYDMSESPPYGPWAEALARASRADDVPPRPDLTGGGAATRDYLAALADRQPLVLLLDDLHWADPASLDLLRFVARDLGRSPLLALATYRADELTRRHPLYQLLPTLVREARATRLDLRRLGDADLRALVRGRYGLPGRDEERLVAYLQDHAEGNPFYAGELLRTLEEERVARPQRDGWVLGDLAGVGVPPLLRQVIDARVTRLGAEAALLLAIAAVIGQEVMLATWAIVAGVAEEQLLGVVERAAEARLLVELPDGVHARFAHALVREALYEGLPPSQRRRLHRVAGEARLPARGQPEPDPDAVAYHFQRAGDPRAAGWLIGAGARAQAAYAWLTAAERYEAALVLLEREPGTALERGWLLFRLARMRRYADPRQALRSIEEALLLAGAADPALAAAATFERGLYLAFRGELEPALAAMAAGVAALEALPPDGRARLREIDSLGVHNRRGTLVMWLANVGRLAEAVAMGERYIAEETATVGAAGLRDSAHGDALLVLGAAYSFLGQPEAGRRAFARAREAYTAAGHRFQASIAAAVGMEFSLHYEADTPARWRQLALEVEAEIAQARGIQPAVAGELLRAATFYQEGRWAEIRRIARDPHLLVGQAMNRIVSTRLLAWVAHGQGARDEAWQAVRECLPAGPAGQPGTWLFPASPLQLLAAALALDEGELETARAWLEAHDRWLAWSGVVLGQAEARLGWAAYHRATGDIAQARANAERALALASGPRQPLALLAAHGLLGELATAGGRYGDAPGQLDAALSLADACAAPYERALALLALADLRLATADRDGAQQVLTEARAILERLEARPALDRAAALAKRLTASDAPESPATPATASPAGLSAREVEVLRLVTQGLTNAQAAERLFLSPRTIDQHLRSIYGKLGVDNRAAASTWAAQHGLIGEVP